jgi:hypothetical protein
MDYLDKGEMLTNWDVTKFHKLFVHIILSFSTHGTWTNTLHVVFLFSIVSQGASVSPVSCEL